MKPLGQVAYEAYANYTGWRSPVTGDQLPSWDRLGQRVQSAWQVAASAVAGELYQRQAEEEDR